MTESSEPPAPIYKWVADVEDLEQYCRGGYHAVHIGDELHSRYRVVHKLGYGSYSTVWLVWDQQENRYASVKIVTADKSKDRTESRVLQHLKPKVGWSWTFWGNNRGNKFVLEALDEFEIQGPNGNHWCVVSKPLGPSLYGMLDYLDSRRLPSNVPQKVTVQLARGLSFLHAHGIVHGDLHEGNLLFCIPGMDLWTAEEVHTYLGEPDLVTITRRDGQLAQPIAPEYAVRPPDPEILIPLCLNDTTSIQIADFGEAFFSTGQSVPRCLGTPVWSAAPETLILDPVGPPSDIWALACLLYRILTGRRLFRSFDGDQDEVLMEMVRTFGKLPDCWWRKWEKRSIYFNEDGGLRPVSGGLAGDGRTKAADLQARLQDTPTLLRPDEISAFETVLRAMLRFEPSERISAEEVVRLLPSSWEDLR